MNFVAIEDVDNMLMMMMMRGGACQMKFFVFVNLEVDDVDVMILPHEFCCYGSC